MTKKEIALGLRREGRSIREVAELVGIARSTASTWCREVELTEDQKIEIDKRNPASQNYAGVRSCDLISERARNKRIAYQKEGMTEAGELDLFLAGCMLYWGEGSKGKNCVKITNYDPAMLKFFVRFLRECFDVKNEQIKIWIVVYTDVEEEVEEAEQFWLQTLELPRSRLGKTKKIVGSKPTMKKNIHKYGGCGLYVGSTEIVQRIFGAIKTYAGLNQPDLWV
jgi:hypothetical protein